MNAATKTILFLVLLLAAGAGLFALFGGGEEEQPPSAVATAPVEDDSPPPAEPIVSELPQPSEPRADPVRREVDTAKSPAEYAQGIRGRVLDPQGAPVAPTKVYLMEASGADIFRQLMLANKGIRIPPIARTETDERGMFQLGVETIEEGKRFEVRVVSDQFVDKNLPPLTIVEGEWYDAGDIRLERGTTLHGRVTIEGSNGLPVPDAEVQIKAQNQFPSVSPTPGREDGLIVKVDHTGSFRIHNAPAGIVTVAAVAPGYARIEKAQLTLDAQADNEVLFELPPGLAIGGMVIDAAGNPIEGAKVEATAISAKTPANGSARSGADGRFEVIGLVGGPYLVTAAAQGYVRVPLKPIQAGTENLEIVLEKQCEAQVRVFDKNNQILRAYTLEVKSYTEGQELFGNTDIPVKRVRTDADGIATVGGLDPEPGRYVFQITAPGHCKAYSEPFKVAIGEKAPLVEVRMNEGGILVGRVTDQRGQPLANVKVQTLPNHYDENPFTSMFRGIIPVNITQQTVTTDSNGDYRFTLLTPGEYQLKFWHPQHFEVFLKNNIVEAGQTTTVGPLAMEHGTVVSGEVRFQGSPAPQAKVTLSSATDPETPSPILFTCDAITDNEGRFTMSKRVPPGRYQVMAARQTLQNPLEQIADFHRTKQEITLGRGQDKYFLQVVIPE